MTAAQSFVESDAVTGKNYQLGACRAVSGLGEDMTRLTQQQKLILFWEVLDLKESLHALWAEIDNPDGDERDVTFRMVDLVKHASIAWSRWPHALHAHRSPSFPCWHPVARSSKPRSAWKQLKHRAVGHFAHIQSCKTTYSSSKTHSPTQGSAKTRWYSNHLTYDSMQDSLYSINPACRSARYA